MFCYYGRHYVAFVHDRAQQIWLQFDDHKVTRVGCTWGKIAARCDDIRPLAGCLAVSPSPRQCVGRGIVVH